MKILSHNGGAARQSSLSGQIVHKYLNLLLPPFIFLLSLFSNSPVLSCLSRSTDDKDAQNQNKQSKYIAFDKGDLQLQATNLAEGQNAQPMLLGDSPDQSILQNGKSYFVAQFSHIFSSCKLRRVWTNMLVNTANIEGAERDWYVLN